VGQNLADTSSLFLCKFLVGRTDLGWTLTEGGTVSTGYVGGFGVVDCPTANVGSNICGGTSTKSGRNHNLFQLVMRVGLGRGWIHIRTALKYSLSEFIPDFRNSITSPIIRFIIYKFTRLLLVICINTS
jgi:hypothetical protein